MDDDIQFGDMEHTAPTSALRPDQNRHYAVVAYQAPGERDLPIYVDVDVMRDMEDHANSNRDVELGGVMLGGQFEDHAGKPFVVISDSLRAEHYESTKGSFKFTHETWRDITNKRDEFPPELQMVGWYHTHPGWGVFLSGMDTFICDHFFNRPLDVALVIDPCQQERGFFQWSSPDCKETRATGGFYLMGSRFRRRELQFYASELEDKSIMATDPRYGSLPPAQVPPVVQLAEARPHWILLAVLGMLTMQFLVVALIAWRLVTPAATEGPPPTASASGDLAAQRAMLDRVIGDLQVAPDGVVSAMEEQRRENDELRSANLGLLARVEQLMEIERQARQEQRELSEQNRELKLTIARLEQDKTTAQQETDRLTEKLAQYETPEDAESQHPVWAWMARWKWWLGGGFLLILAAVAAAFAFYTPPPTEQEQRESPVSERRQTNDHSA